MTSPPRTFNIFDHGLAARTGHHYDFCFNIARALVRRGFATTVYGHRDAGADVVAAFGAIGCTLVPLFSDFAYAPIAPESLTITAMEATARRTAAELASVGAADLSLFPTLMPELFLAYAYCEHPGPMIAMAHYEPNFHHRLGGALWARAGAIAQRRALPVRIGAIDPVIGDYLRTYNRQLPIVEMPVPQGGVAKSSYSDTIQTVGFFGNQRNERGLELFPALVQKLLALGYEVVVHDTSGYIKVEGIDPRLRLLPFVSDLCAEMARCDLVLCPMNRRNYQLRQSGIVCAAVAAGVPVVLPAGTLPAVQFHRLGSSSCYHLHSVDGIMGAVETMAANYPAYAEGARNGARLWAQRNGVDKFIDHLLADTAA